MGAQIVMLHFIKWIKQHTDYQVTMLLKAGGELLPAFQQLGLTYVWRPGLKSPAPGRRVLNVFRRQMGKPELEVPFPKALTGQDFDLVYLNTADCLAFAPLLKQFYKCRFYAHIHELSYSLQAYFPDAFNAGNTTAVDHYIAASDSVRRSLIKKQGIDENKITVFNEFIAIKELTAFSTTSAEIRKELGLDSGFIVGAAGQAGWRKGTDLFLQIAAKVNQLSPGNMIKFVWVGYQSPEFQAQADYEITRMGLVGQVIFTGVKENLQDYYQVFDLFLLASREDPFPLVALEAAAMQKPVFCFEDTGGIPEIITSETGATVPYGNIDEMATAIEKAAGNLKHTRRQGEIASKMMQQFDVNEIAPKLFNFITNTR